MCFIENYQARSNIGPSIKMQFGCAMFGQSGVPGASVVHGLRGWPNHCSMYLQQLRLRTEWLVSISQQPASRVNMGSRASQWRESEASRIWHIQILLIEISHPPLDIYEQFKSANSNGRHFSPLCKGKKKIGYI